jgi:photosystem II stability/assembly factor-like uncharacterized protein
MKTRLLKAFIAMASLPATWMIPAQAQITATPTKMQKVQAMHLVTGTTGWVAGPKNLMLTQDAGQHWTDITPKGQPFGSIKSVFFLNAVEGWAVSSSAGGSSAAFAVSRTSDAGANWTSGSLTASFEEGSYPVSLDFADAQHGWLMLKAPSSSNFSRGVLLATTDGGASWKALPTPPIGDAVRFTSASTGWLAGGPAGNELYVTRDSGQSWQQQTVATPAGADADTAVYQLPKFVNDSEGTIAVEFVGAETSQVVVYETQNRGLNWMDHNSVTARSGVNRTVASVVDANTFFVAAGSREGLVASAHGAQSENAQFYGKLASYEAVSALDFTDDHNGWVLVDGGHCAVGKTQCSQESRLLATSDGGQTVKDVTPLVATSDATTSGGIQPATVTTLPDDLRGFDKCAVGTVSQMKAWYVETPWLYANVYIGGDQRGCTQPNLSASWINSIRNQGWYLIPTWVGPQSPTTNCSGCNIRISTNTGEAERQGIEQADAATDEANALGMSPKTIIYYDMEEYNGDSNPVRWFIQGWVTELHKRGNLAGVYGAPANAGDDWSVIFNPPDDVWIADWNGSTSVYGLAGLSNNAWDHDQRIHQYEGVHNETWGGVTFSIDSDSSDGAVACGDLCY